MKMSKELVESPVNADRVRYEAPTLTELGAAAEVVLGISGGGFDGDFGMTDPEFEFEADATPTE